MDDIYTNLENYDDFNKLEELQNENKNLKCKIEEYTSAINKLQKDFDMLAAEHKKLELNYSSLLKTAKAEIERKTHMIKELNLEKDRLIINARQNNIKSKFNKFQSDRFNQSNKSSDTGSVQGQPQTPNPPSQATNEYKYNSSPLDTTSTCSGDTRDLNDAVSTAGKNIKCDTENYISKENPVQVSNNNSNTQTETKVKKIMNRRKSMPVSGCRDVNFSSDDEGESSVTTANKIQYRKKDEIKRSTDRHYQNMKTYETSNLENNYTQYEASGYSRIKPHYYSDNYRSRDSYDLQRRRWNISDDRSTHRSGRDYADHYQMYNWRGYESPPRDKHYHQSRTTDRRYTYHRDRSRDYRNDSERYAEKHKLQDLEEPGYKRQKYEHSHKYTDDGRHREGSAGRPALPTIFEMSVSCQSPDYMQPDSHISTAPVKEIRSTAIMHLEDPRLSSKKYKLLTDCDKEILTTVIGRNIQITPVNKKLWGFNPVPIPKALIEPPSFEYNINKKLTIDDDYASHNIFVNSDVISNRAKDDEIRNESVDLTSNPTSATDFTVPIETQDKNSSKIHTSVDKDSNSQDIKGNNDKMSAKESSSGYRIPKKQISLEVLTKIETLDSNKFPKLNSKENSSVSAQDTRSTIDAKSSQPSDIKSNTDKDDYYSLEKRQTELYVENIIENRNHELSRKIVESDLTLSDDTSDYYEPQLTIIETQTKDKGKRNKRKESSERHKSNGLDTRKSESASESLPDANTEVRCKRSPEEDKIKRKGEPTEHTKKQKHKKKQEYKDCGVEDPKTCKPKKAKKETKTTEIKTKFSELFGDSSSLITCDDLGVVPREPEHRTNFNTLIEDTQDAVDINIKEIENQVTKLTHDSDQNESVEEQVDRQTHTSSKVDSFNENKKCDDLKISIRKKEDKYSIVHESTEPINKNINSDVCSIPKTIIISTGVQQQNTFNHNEFRQPMNVTSFEKVVQPFPCPGLEALATSTPAKLTQEQSQKDSITTQSDCSSSSTDARMDMPQTRNDPSCTESQNSDVPDVRIFVKRRRKAKKCTP